MAKSKPPAPEKDLFRLLYAALEHFKDAPYRYKAPVTILTIFLGLTGTLGVAFLTQGSTNYAFASFAVSALLALFTLYGLAQIGKLPESRKSPDGNPPPTSGVEHSPLGNPAAGFTRTWSRAVLELPLSEQARDYLHAALEDIRKEAFIRLTDVVNNPITLPDLRANIFLPDYNLASDGYACQLTIPEKLRVNMNGHSDSDIKFRPGQGCTGRAFVKEEPQTGHAAIDAGPQKWDDVYRLSPTQKSLLHPDLRWVVSIPLNFVDPEKKQPKTIGVLNVDGLRHSLDKNTLLQLTATVTAFVVKRIQPRLEEMTKVRLEVGIKRAL